MRRSGNPVVVNPLVPEQIRGCSTPRAASTTASPPRSSSSLCDHGSEGGAPGNCWPGLREDLVGPLTGVALGSPAACCSTGGRPGGRRGSSGQLAILALALAASSRSTPWAATASSPLRRRTRVRHRHSARRGSRRLARRRRLKLSSPSGRGRERVRDPPRRHDDLRPLLYAILSLTVVRMLPVALALIGTRLRRDTILFMGWFGPRGLASIVFAILGLEACTGRAWRPTSSPRRSPDGPPVGGPPRPVGRTAGRPLRTAHRDRAGGDPGDGRGR